MTNSHTPEPWKYMPNKHDDWGFIRDQKGTLVAKALNSDISYEQHDEYRIKGKDPYYHNAARIIACVNAMAGIENPEKWVKDQKQYRNGMFNSCLSIELQKRMELEEQYKNLLQLYELAQVEFHKLHKMNPGQISKSMGVDTKPAHKFEIGKFWVMADPKMPESMFEKLKMAAMIHDVGISCSEISNNSFERNIDISTADLINAGFVSKTDYDKDFTDDEYYSIKYTTFKRKIVGDIEIHVTDNFKFKDAPDEWDYLNTRVELNFYGHFQELQITKFFQLVTLIKILEGTNKL